MRATSGAAVRVAGRASMTGEDRPGDALNAAATHGSCISLAMDLRLTWPSMSFTAEFGRNEAAEGAL
jgi:hypothetical protein